MWNTSGVCARRSDFPGACAWYFRESTEWCLCRLCLKPGNKGQRSGLVINVLLVPTTLLFLASHGGGSTFSAASVWLIDANRNLPLWKFTQRGSVIPVSEISQMSFLHERLEVSSSAPRAPAKHQAFPASSLMLHTEPPIPPTSHSVVLPKRSTTWPTAGRIRESGLCFTAHHLLYTWPLQQELPGL